MPRTFFAEDYAQARQAFGEAAHTVGAQISSYVNPKRGIAGEELATDAAWIGPRQARCVLVSISATHGVEGFYGSACQINWLTAMAQGEQPLPPDTAVLMVHALNPYGFSWTRRVNEDNIDINRNHLNFSNLPLVNLGYEEVHELILPTAWDEATQARVQSDLWDFMHRVGPRAASLAISGGQYHHANGIFYGGTSLCWSNQTLNTIVQSHLQHAKAIAVLDHHTGLGPTGHTELICRHPVDSKALSLARSWWGADVTSPAAGESASAVIDGNVRMAVGPLCPQAQVVSIAIEVGTQSKKEVIFALLADNWLHQNGDLQTPLAHHIKRQVRDAFLVDTQNWHDQALERAKTIWQQALTGLPQALRGG